MKRLTEVDLEVLLAEAAPANKKRKGAPYTGRSRELIESEVQALLGEEEERDNGLEDDEACPSTSQADQTDNSNSSALGESSQSGEVIEALQEQEDQLAMEMVDVQQQVAIGESFAIIDDSSENASIWATETGESVVVTISEDGQALVTTAGVTVQQDLHATFIEGELLMLEWKKKPTALLLHLQPGTWKENRQGEWRRIFFLYIFPNINVTMKNKERKNKKKSSVKAEIDFCCIWFSEFLSTRPPSSGNFENHVNIKTWTRPYRSNVPI